MSAQIIPFFYNDKPVRSVQRSGEPWFVGRDVYGVLDLVNTAKSLERLDEDEKGITTVYTLGGPQEMIIISEAGVCRQTRRHCSAVNAFGRAAF